MAVALLSSCAKDVTKDIEAMADKACACTEVECARGVADSFLKLIQDNKRGRFDEKRAGAAIERVADCILEAGLPPIEVMELGEKMSNM